MKREIAGLGCLYMVAVAGQLMVYIGAIWLIVVIVKHVWQG
jgi:hypothetical protein